MTSAMRMSGSERYGNAAGGATCASSARSQEFAQRTQVDVEVLVLEPETLLQFLHPLLELHERLAEAFDLVFGQRAGFHAADGLALHELAEQLEQREHELCEPAFDVVRIGVHA